MLPREDRGPVAVPTLYRPAALGGIKRDPAPRPVVVTGVAAGPLPALAAALRAIHRGMDASVNVGSAIDQAALTRIVPTADARAGTAAFVEKRRPSCTGG